MKENDEILYLLAKNLGKIAKFVELVNEDTIS